MFPMVGKFFWETKEIKLETKIEENKNCQTIMTISDNGELQGRFETRCMDGNALGERIFETTWTPTFSSARADNSARRNVANGLAGGKRKTNRRKGEKGCGREVEEENLQEYLECRFADSNSLEGGRKQH